MRRRLFFPISGLFFPICAFLPFSFGCGGKDQPVKPGANDTTPPGAIEGPFLTGPPGRSVTFTWRAPGDDGMDGRADRYDIRYAADSLTEASWNSATAVASPPEPGAAGTWETFTISGLALGRWFIGVRAADEASNWSALTGCIGASVVDAVAPAPVTDLRVLSSTRTSVTLAWTAPGNDGMEGQATEIDLRFLREEITPLKWSEAERVSGVPAPPPPGAVDTFTVIGLAPETTFHLALKIGDESGNWSALSNDVAAATISLGRITRCPEGTAATAATWSPDGTQIAFSADWDGNPEIYRMAVAGGDPVRLTADPGVDSQPAWSPDGSTIAFNTNRGGKAELYRMDAADGSNVLFLADEHVDSGMWLRRPAWSPDGTRIAYVDGILQMNVSPTRIFTIAAGGGTPQLIMDHGENYGYFDPSFSPDGTRLVVGSGRNHQWGLWIQPLAGGDPAPLISSLSEQYLQPAWSPDGSRIAFTSCTAGVCEVFVVAASGGTPVQLTFPPRRASYPSWSPDGRRIALNLWIEGDISGGDIWELDME